MLHALLFLTLVPAHVTGAFGTLQLVAPARIAHPESMLRIESQQVALDCHENAARDRLTCAADVRYVIRNSSRMPAEEKLMLAVGTSVSDLHVDVDGTVESTDEAGRRLLTLTVPPGGRAGIRVRGRTRRNSSTPEEDPLWTLFPALRARHPIASDHYTHRGYLLSAGGARFLEHDTIGVSRIRAPGLSLVDPRGDELRPVGDGWYESRDYGFSGTARRSNTETAFWNGGPVLGIGAGRDEYGSPRFRGRLAWELGIGELFVGALGVESDLEQLLCFAASIGVATPFFAYFVPSFEARIGAVVDVLPSPRAGLRLVAALGAWFVGLEAAFDIFPQQDLWRFALSGRLSL